ncbi:hypothetical protein JCM11251_004630 [Rhodosporidiobolus azoricus]
MADLALLLHGFDAPPPLPQPSTSHSTDSGPLIRCSQCKKHKAATEFPTRLINLEPYQVCLTHNWYWTKEKQAVHWAPTDETSMGELCEEVKALKEGEKGASDKWLVKGSAEDRAAIVQSIATAGRWKSKKITLRKSGSKSDSPPHPTFQYTLSPILVDDDGGNFKLTMYEHEAAGNYTLTVRPEDKKKQTQPWARPERVRKAKKDKEEAAAIPSPTVWADNPTPPAMSLSMDATTPAVNELGTALQAHDSLALLVDAAASFSNVDIAVGNTSANRADHEQGALDAAPPRSSQEMPPPPLPRPPKKKRRVEPSLISTIPSSSSTSNSFSTAAGAAEAAQSSWANIFSFPSLVQPTPTAPIPPNAGSSAAMSGPYDYSTDAQLVAFLNSLGALPAAPTPTAPAPSSSSSLVSTAPSALPLTPAQPLTLSDLLNNPFLTPPNIPLPPRQPAPTPSSAPKARSKLRHPTGAAEATDDSGQTTKAGKDLDDAVADALGSSSAAGGQAGSRQGQVAAKRPKQRAVLSSVPPTYASAASSDVPAAASTFAKGESGEGEVDEYEDSIPDDSEVEGEGDEGEEGDEESIFESSAEEEESLDGSSGGEDDESDEDEWEDEEGEGEEDDWLVGFAVRQMPGMEGGEGTAAAASPASSSSRGRRRTGSSGGAGETVPHEEVDEEDELDSGAE